MKCQTTKLNLSKIALILLFGSLISNTFCNENSKGLAKVRILKSEADAKELAKYTSNPIIVNRKNIARPEQGCLLPQQHAAPESADLLAGCDLRVRQYGEMPSLRSCAVQGGGH